MDILKYGADVEVLAPDSLRSAVSAQLTAAAKLYPR
jgi:predicted DNA-binding transcriptional regulator YafY